MRTEKGNEKRGPRVFGKSAWMCFVTVLRMDHKKRGITWPLAASSAPEDDREALEVH